MFKCTEKCNKFERTNGLALASGSLPIGKRICIATGSSSTTKKVKYVVGLTVLS